MTPHTRYTVHLRRTEEYVAGVRYYRTVPFEKTTLYLRKNDAIKLASKWNHRRESPDYPDGMKWPVAEVVKVKVELET